MDNVVECRGAPRAMGLDQGRAVRPSVRDRVARAGLSSRRRSLLSLRPHASGPVLGRGSGRQLLRHYPHLGERMAGLAGATGLSLETLMQLTLDDAPLAVGRPADGDVAVAVPGALLARSLPAPAHGGQGLGDWILRCSRPEVGFASLEVTLPWLVSALAGVNERGLAVAIAPSKSPAASGSEPPALLLVQECLQRFSDLDASLDWCLKRPAAGPARLLLGDASGEVAIVEIGGHDRRVVRADDRVLALGGPPDLDGRVRKRLEQEGSVSRAVLSLELAEPSSAAPPPSWLVALDVLGRRLHVARLDGRDAVELEL